MWRAGGCDGAMLTIRPAQVRALEESGRAEYLARVLAYVRDRYPVTLAGMGEDEAQARIAYGDAHAADYGFAGPTKAQFIELTFLFGRGFEESEEWAVDALAGVSDPAAAARRLHEIGLSLSDHGD